MLEINRIRQDKDRVIELLLVKNLKNAKEKIEEIISKDEEKRGVQKKVEEIKAELNLKSKEIGSLIKDGKKDEAEKTKAQVGELKNNEKELGVELIKMEEELRDLLLSIPNLDWVGDDITQGFARLKTYYPELPIPNLYTLIIGPDDFSYAYNSRIIATRDFISIAIDLYSIKSFGEKHYYSYFPKYMQNVLDSNYLTPDVFYTYLREVATIEVPLVEENPSPSLLEIMVERGKYLYAVKELLPSYELKDVLRYSQEEMKWAQENEYNIWSYLTQNRLLFEKDRTKYMGFITEGPTTRGIPNSPSRLGEYIGYKIVERYMEKNKLGIKELLETIDMEKILKDSGYKPKKK